MIVPIHLDLDERPILSELRFHSLDVVADPKGEVYQLLLRRFGAVEMLVGFIGGDFSGNPASRHPPSDCGYSPLS